MHRILITGPRFRTNFRMLHALQAVPHDGLRICVADWGSEPEDADDATWLILDDNGAEDVFRPERYALLDSGTVEQRWSQILEYCEVSADEQSVRAADELWKQEKEI